MWCTHYPTLLSIHSLTHSLTHSLGFGHTHTRKARIVANPTSTAVQQGTTVYYITAGPSYGKGNQTSSVVLQALLRIFAAAYPRSIVGRGPDPAPHPPLVCGFLWTTPKSQISLFLRLVVACTDTRIYCQFFCLVLVVEAGPFCTVAAILPRYCPALPCPALPCPLRPGCLPPPLCPASSGLLKLVRLEVGCARYLACQVHPALMHRTALHRTSTKWTK
jgi:hypothetical protein